MRVVNTGEKAFSFTCALHTYFAVSDIADVSVQGLKGCSYEDALLPPVSAPVIEVCVSGVCGGSRSGGGAREERERP